MAESAIAIKEALRENPTVSTDRLRNLVESFFACAGGEHVFARMLWETYNDPKTTPMIKSRITQFILDSARHVDKKNAPEDLDKLTDEELNRTIEAVVAEIASRQNGEKEA